jgi:HSP20 family molecular chaperone IbpA
MSQALQERRTKDTSERAQPLSDVERLRRMLDQTFGSFGLPALATESVGWTPPVDIEEQDDAFVIEAEVSGVKKDDVNIELISNELMITGRSRSANARASSASAPAASAASSTAYACLSRSTPTTSRRSSRTACCRSACPSTSRRSGAGSR